MALTGPKTGFKTTDPNNGSLQDLGDLYISKDYLLDIYPNLVPGRTTSGLWAIGYNSYGQLGNGVQINYSSPIQIGSLTNWKQVTGGGSYNGNMAAVKTDGTLWCCGYNAYGQLGNGTTTHYSSPIQVGALTNWKQVAIGSNVLMAIKTDNTLWGWGQNQYYGILGNGSATSNYSSPIQVGTLTNWKQISVGGGFFASVKIDGTLWTCGYNSYGENGNNTLSHYSSPIQVGALTTWKQVSCGYNHTLVISTNGTLWSFGKNDYGQLGNGTGDYYSSPIQVGALTNWKQVSGSYRTLSAVKTNGTLWTCGYNSSGQLGNNNIINYSSPIQVGALTNWKWVSNGINSIAAISKEGTVWVWGSNSNGQLGNGTYSNNYSSPIQLGALTSWKQVSYGYNWFLGITDGYI